MHKNLLIVALTLGAAASIGEIPSIAVGAGAPKGISQSQKAADALEISNLVGRYAIYVIAEDWKTIGTLFALDDPDVRMSIPTVISGPALRKWMDDRYAAKHADGTMLQHAFMSPLIEIAGDGKTAKGVWDSPGLDAGSGNSMANWSWIRYGIDFKKIDGTWKMWHLHVWPVWRAPYGEEWSKMVQTASAGKMTGGATTAEVPRSANAGPPPGTQGPAQWRYNGVGDTPVIPPNPPTPYYTFDPATAY